MPVLIFARHGNTFEKDQTPTWVGARTDLPLTAEGEAQAQRVADLVAARYAPLGGIIAGPLKRTRRMADIVAAKVNNVFTVDERLIEIDYGFWENKSGEEIAATYGRAMLEAWEKEGVWPEEMRWAPNLEKLEHNIAAFLDEQHKILGQPLALNRLAVTSNGILRFVYRALTGCHPGADAKVKTGAYCVLEPTASGWTILEWNVRP
jgi:probable phosphoglycerate mutase